MRRAWVLIILGVLLVACEAVVGGDLGSYKSSCSPIDDRCPKFAPCVYDFDAFSFRCEAHAGKKGEDSLCATEAECAPGYTCEQFKNNTSAHCVPYCSANEQCVIGTGCFPFTKTRSLPTGEPVGGCGPLDTPCDPVATSSSCGSGKRCTFYDTDYTKCDTLRESRPAGDACDDISQCAQGSTCWGSQTNGYFCRKLCDFAMPSACNPMTTCKEFPSPWMLDTKHLGLCLP